MIKNISFYNWQCYRGMHSISLGPHAYAITARHELDPGRSNFLGKSSILEAIEFALFGKLNKDRKFNADDWISKGEKEGAVSVVLEGDIAIKRERTRGKSTQVRFSTPKSEMASQDEAESKMLKHLLFDADDFRTVSYFAQGMMSRIIRTESEKRFDIVRGWLNLQKAEEAESRAHDIAISKVRELQKLKARRDAIEHLTKDVNSDEGDLDQKIKDKKKLLGHIESLEADKKQQRKYEDLRSLVEQFDNIIQEGKELTTQIDKYPEDLDKQAEEKSDKLRVLYADYSEASKDTASKRTVASGEFDGKCPVAGIQCPATKQINDDRKTSSDRYQKALKIEKQKKAEYEEFRDEVAEIINLSKERSKKVAQRKLLREQVAEMRDEVVEAKKILKDAETKDVEEIDAEINRTYEQVHELSAEIGAVQSRRKQKAELETEYTQIKAQIDSLAKEAAIATQTRSILRVTQRRVSERALSAIGRKVNDMLLGAGVDLKLDIQWEREGKNLAKTCDTCGTPFPSSAKVKECESCGTERGQHVIQKLEFIPSDRSGAADDFTGIAFQLAAGSWLLRERSSCWGTAMLDEPLSQMDKSLRRAAAKQLLNMVGASAYRQLFVISHDQPSVEMFPHRIEIVVEKSGKRRIEVT